MSPCALLTRQALVSFQALVSIAYETAHWLSRRSRGYMPYDSDVNPSQANFSLQPTDVGTIAITQLFGSQYVHGLASKLTKPASRC